MEVELDDLPSSQLAVPIYSQCHWLAEWAWPGLSELCRRCPDDTAHGPDDTDRGYGRYGPVRYTPIYTPRYDNNSYQYHTVVLVTARPLLKKP